MKKFLIYTFVFGIIFHGHFFGRQNKATKRVRHCSGGVCRLV